MLFSTIDRAHPHTRHSRASQRRERHIHKIYMPTYPYMDAYSIACGSLQVCLRAYSNRGVCQRVLLAAVFSETSQQTRKRKTGINRFASPAKGHKALPPISHEDGRHPALSLLLLLSTRMKRAGATEEKQTWEREDGEEARNQRNQVHAHNEQDAKRRVTKTYTHACLDVNRCMHARVCTRIYVSF